MKSLLRACASTVALLALSSCTTTSMVQVWRDPNYKATPVNRIFVIAIMPNDAYRVSFENALAQAFVSKGFQAATEASVFPPGQLDKEKARQYVADNKVDLVVVQRLTKKTSEVYVPPTAYYTGGYYGAYRYGYGMYGGGMAYSPGYMSEETNVVAETSVYSTSTSPETLVWAGNSDTFNVQGAQDASQSLAASLVGDLIKAGILVK